jgi:hypothetical protein
MDVVKFYFGLAKAGHGKFKVWPPDIEIIHGLFKIKVGSRVKRAFQLSRLSSAMALTYGLCVT